MRSGPKCLFPAIYFFFKGILLDLLLTLTPFESLQQIRAENPSAQHGLSPIRISSILQDWQGLIWMAIRDGLPGCGGSAIKTREIVRGDFPLTNTQVPKFSDERNEEGVSVNGTRYPPWWKTWWAYTLYFLAIMIALYFIRRFELNRQRLKQQLALEHIHAEKLEEIDRMKSRFFANISHEFRTPLTLIRGPVEQLLSGAFQGNLKSQYQMILRSCDRLLQLINQLLDLSRLESGGMKLRACPENIVELTRGLVMSFESLAHQKNIDLQFHAEEIGQSPLVAYIDRQKYEEIVTNLLLNAFKFTSTGGVISVAVARGNSNRSDAGLEIPPGGAEGASGSDLKNRKPAISAWPAPGDSAGARFPKSETGEFVEIRIRDTGIGIPARHLEKIFDRFYQAEYSPYHEQGGAGIGLALVKELVELQKGEISVRSEVDRGTEFIVRLRLGTGHLREEEILSEAEATKSGEGGGWSDQLFPLAHPKPASPNPQSQLTANQLLTILIVEDNPDMRAYLRNCLDGNSCIIEAENGAAGLKQARKAFPELIVSDVMMPEMDGFEFCRKIKTDERTSHIPVILLTARADQRDKLSGLEIGADDYLIKPFDARELQARIKNLVEQRRNLREKFQKKLSIEPKEVTATSMDEAFLRKALDTVEARLSDEKLDTAALAKALGISRGHLNAKLRAITGHSTREFICTLRLKRAAQLLKDHSGTISEIAYNVGFNNLSYFAKAFRKQFGVPPSEYK